MAVVKSYWQSWAPPVSGRQEIPRPRSEQAQQSLPTCLCGELSFFVIARHFLPLSLRGTIVPKQSLRWALGLTGPAY
jgi:hypothetical protein